MTKKQYVIKTLIIVVISVLAMTVMASLLTAWNPAVTMFFVIVISLSMVGAISRTTVAYHRAQLERQREELRREKVEQAKAAPLSKAAEKKRALVEAQKNRAARAAQDTDNDAEDSQG